VLLPALLDGSNVPRLRAHAALGAILLSGTLALGGCGESKEEKAKKTACAARTEIKHEVEHLQSLTPTPAALGEVKTDIEGITENVKKMATAAKELAPSRKEEMEKATETFKREIDEAFSGLTTSGSTTQLLSEFTTALDKLGAAYKQALAPVNCT
jgi:Tfp pilus assembly protein PilP